MLFNETYVSALFHRFNREIFRSQLPVVRFEACHAKSYAALYCYRKNPITRRTLPESRRIRYSTFYSLPERKLEEIMVHEMLHLFIELKDLQDTAPHGRLFRALGAEIKAAHGYDVNAPLRLKVTDGGVSVNGEAVEDDTTRRGYNYFFCLMELDADHYGLCTVTKTAIFRLWDSLPAAFGCRHWKWYVSRHIFFSQFPKSRGVPRYFKVKRTEIAPLTGDMRELTRRGDLITW